MPKKFQMELTDTREIFVLTHHAKTYRGRERQNPGILDLDTKWRQSVTAPTALPR